MPRQRDQTPHVGSPIASPAHDRGIDHLLAVQADAPADEPRPWVEPQQRRRHFLGHRSGEVAPFQVQQLVTDDAALERRLEAVERDRQHHGWAEQPEAAGHPDIRRLNEGGRRPGPRQELPRRRRRGDPVGRAGETAEPHEAQPEPDQPEDGDRGQEPQDPRPRVDAPPLGGQGDDALGNRVAGDARGLPLGFDQGQSRGGRRRGRLPGLDPRREQQDEEDRLPVPQQEAGLAKSQDGNPEPSGPGHAGGLQPVRDDILGQQLSRHRPRPARSAGSRCLGDRRR